MTKAMSARDWRGFGLALLAGAAMVAAVSTARAGECPADKMGVNVTPPGEMMPKDVTDNVLGAIDLAKEPAQLQGHMLRIRQLEIKPGGVVPWHSHGDRPALIYIVKGEITEYASNCAVPILHKAGDVARETHLTSHWWKNTGRDTVVLLSADLLHDPNDKNM